jgi:membrane fusion protein, copper/silver efflux system
MPMYTCPMHPDVRMDKPANCPKCGAKLVQRDEGSSTTTSRTGKQPPTRER